MKHEDQLKIRGHFLCDYSTELALTLYSISYWVSKNGGSLKQFSLAVLILLQIDDLYVPL